MSKTILAINPLTPDRILKISFVHLKSTFLMKLFQHHVYAGYMGLIWELFLCMERFSLLELWNSLSSGGLWHSICKSAIIILLFIFQKYLENQITVYFSCGHCRMIKTNLRSFNITLPFKGILQWQGDSLAHKH